MLGDYETGEGGRGHNTGIKTGAMPMGRRGRGRRREEGESTTFIC